ncbi:hypothetical protein [Mucilaginibacter gotjawali]|uniref:Uncharacterized protein n=2 Tax=Mucilaginibacter gotjawali TaxID=1550579 RepID=A0A839SD19_9SPHI|nr:hypothetical protein [Mucilaginibacter gotjawali]MBB3056115.1 hypothetical protein [Mucilaginibacter gotjawali]BAU53548.1 hypothetical protein MgSA37_01717 [Mucilaginibacter gotjawali]
MEDVLKRQKPEVRMRAFRAIDEPETCELFIKGHTEVLTSIGVTKVTSSKNGWADNPAVFVIIVESLDGKKVYGGARVHVSGGSEPLPIEQATGKMDPGVYQLVWARAQQGTGEICGLWNSNELAGYGIGTPLLIRTLIAISSQIGLKSLFALCAPYTVKPVVNCGMVLVDSIGNNGTFYYPKLDLVATAMILHDVSALSKAREDDRLAIFEMRAKPDTFKINELKNKEITIDFQLTIPNLDQWNLAETITAASLTFLGNKIGENAPAFF